MEEHHQRGKLQIPTLTNKFHDRFFCQLLRITSPHFFSHPCFRFAAPCGFLPCKTDIPNPPVLLTHKHTCASIDLRCSYTISGAVFFALFSIISKKQRFFNTFLLFFFSDPCSHFILQYITIAFRQACHFASPGRKAISVSLSRIFPTGLCALQRIRSEVCRSAGQSKIYNAFFASFASANGPGTTRIPR